MPASLRSFRKAAQSGRWRCLPDGWLASGGGDGTMKLLAREGTGEPVVLKHGGLVRALAVLKDGRLASGSDDGTIKLWPSEGTDEPVVISHGSRLYALAGLPDGRLAAPARTARSTLAC